MAKKKKKKVKVYRGFWKRYWAIYIPGPKKVKVGDLVEVKKQRTIPPYEILEIGEIHDSGRFDNGNYYHFVKPVWIPGPPNSRPRAKVISRSWKSVIPFKRLNF